MKILAMDSSGLVASVAVVEDDNLIGEYTVHYKKTHSQTLLPMLDEVSKMIELDLQSVDAIAVAGGPGSFTGLRIGSATAKGLGMVLEKPIVSVPTVEGLAYNLSESSCVICPLMDARRNQVYTGLFEFDHGKLHRILEQCAIGIDEVLARIHELGRETVFLGDGAVAYRDYIIGHCEVSYSFAPAHLNKQRASAVAVLAMQYYAEGKVQTAEEHRPEYLRLSQAERERQKKEEKQ